MQDLGKLVSVDGHGEHVFKHYSEETSGKKSLLELILSFNPFS